MTEPHARPGRRVEKAPGAFRTISEVAEELNMPQHVLRFWESKFAQVRPLKRGGGRRYYRPEDVTLLRLIRGLLYDQGYTIRGVQKVLKDQTRNGDEAANGVAAAEHGSLAPEHRKRLAAVLRELDEARDLLRRVLG
ncbi:MAG: MerR family transcriptional regulator [Alphaproteobacteria bacterium]|nr:MerR family transcriptional regulator [Alphaproteobacteria bacterium]